MTDTKLLDLVTQWCKCLDGRTATQLKSAIAQHLGVSPEDVFKHPKVNQAYLEADAGKEARRFWGIN